MTIDEMFNELEDKARDTFIVTLKYKYDFEENYTIENHILEYDSITDSYVWLNDWYEGQTDIEVLGYMPLGDVDTTVTPKTKWTPVSELQNEMTNEECIEILYDIQTDIVYGLLNEEKEAIDMAIKVLKSQEKMIDAIDFAIKATDSQDDYSMGMRNGMRYVKSLIDSKEPQYELRRTDEEIKLGIDLGDEVVGDYGSKGVVVGIDTYKGKVLLSLLTRKHKVPQLVEASRYKKTGRHFDAIEKLYEEMEKGEADGK